MQIVWYNITNKRFQEDFMGLWSYEHLITIPLTFAVMIALSLLLRLWLLGKDYETRMLPLKIIAVIIVVIEIGKQICSFARGYNLYHIPLHFCSIFLYIIPLFAFYRGKYRESVASVATSTMTALFIGMLAIPAVIYGADRIPTFFTDYLSFHTVFFHNLVIFAFLLTIALDLHKPTGKKGESLFIAAFGAVFVAVAASASHILQTNFSNFLNSTVGFIKEITDNLALAIGEIPTKIIYTITLALLHIALMVLANYIYLLICVGKERLIKLMKKSKKVES